MLGEGIRHMDPGTEGEEKGFTVKLNNPATSKKIAVSSHVRLALLFFVS